MEYIGDCYSLDCTIVIRQMRHVQMAECGIQFSHFG